MAILRATRVHVIPNVCTSYNSEESIYVPIILVKLKDTSMFSNQNFCQGIAKRRATSVMDCEMKFLPKYM